ncbi:hypothetical protein OF829_11330 [Sphingomonas sp. LB-2]|uniref:hypothetical protein n=1 Tax=Sphingomonas caeni TaxID=2984949 RepID=UPI00222FBA5E|nr:hypothetical protein [Sphingomonas caeni]MCW3847832.1 hypothetical protein [Sphingomonas caeni]
MSGGFDIVMRRMPQIMTVLAVVYYVATVTVSLTMGDELNRNFGDAVPPEFRLRAFMIIFVQPLVSATILLFGAALLWRIDRWIANQGAAK